MVLVAIATVASFEAVGSILVIAMLICPAATARLLTDRLSRQVLLSVVVAIATAVLGYRAATVVPSWFDDESVNAAGSMAMTAGIILVAAILLAPVHGVVSRSIRSRRLARRIAVDDLLATLLRTEEARSPDAVPASAVNLLRPPKPAAIERARRSGLVEGRSGSDLRLTEDGRRVARDVLRRHRLWETYLVEEAGLSPDHVHDPAEVLEHLGPIPSIRSSRDPHGRPIPDPD